MALGWRPLRIWARGQLLQDYPLLRTLNTADLERKAIATLWRQFLEGVNWKEVSSFQEEFVWYLNVNRMCIATG